MFSWGKPFIFKSKPYDWYETVYYHQLTEGFSFVPKYKGMTEVYEEFNTLAHVTNFESLGQIFEDGYIKHHYVKDSSVSNPDKELYSLNGEKARVGLHPLARSKIVWYGTYTKERAKDQTESIERYGNIMFTLDKLMGYGGILSGSHKYYLVEVVHYRTQTATRILVTNKEYPDLRRYDPFKVGGPWYYDMMNEKNWCLTKAIHFTSKKEVRNTVEFMMDESLLDLQLKLWLENHELSHKKCYSPRKGVRVARDTDESLLRLVLGTIAYKLVQKNPVQTKAKMPKCTEFVRLSEIGYAKVRFLLEQLRSKCTANQDAQNGIQDAQNDVSMTDNGVQEDAQNGVGDRVQEDAQNEVGDSVQEGAQNGVGDRVQEDAQNGVGDRVQEDAQNEVGDSVQEGAQNGVGDRVQEGAQNRVGDRVQERAQNGFSESRDSVLEHVQNGVSGVGNSVQNGIQNGVSGSDVADTLLETMQRSRYGEIGDQLLKLKNILGAQSSFHHFSSAKVADILLIFFRQEFFKLQIPLKQTFEAIMKFLEPSGISAFFDILETMIDDSMPRVGREQSN